MADQIVHRRRRTIKQQTISSPPKQTIRSNSQPVRINFLHLLVILSITFVVYAPALQNDFTNWDDQAYVLHNPMIKQLSWHTVKEIFASHDLHKRYWMGNYHPLTMLSLNLTYQYAHQSDGKPIAYLFILTNILIHLLNTLLVYIFVLKLAKSEKLAFVVALLFGIHTLHVESVAWIAERKDVLYSLFFIWSLIEYINFVDTRKWSHYFWSFVLFTLSLLSKGQAVSLAVTIVLIDIFRQRKWLSFKVLLEKVPYFILSLIFGLIAIEAQKYSMAIVDTGFYPLYKRIGIAGYGLLMYMLKLILPVHLSALYPYPDIIHKTIPAYYYFAAIFDFLTLGLFFIWLKKRQYLAAFGFAFFLVNIFLLLQLIPVGSAIYADRYSYIPSIGWFILIGYYLVKIRSKQLYYLSLAAYSVILGFLTFNRVQIWRNSLSLWQDTVKKSPKAVVAWNNLGSELSNQAAELKSQGKLNESKTLFLASIDKFSHAIQGKPDYANAFYNRAVAEYNLFLITQDSSYIYKALNDINNAIAIKIDFKDAFLQRGLLYDLLGKPENARFDYQRVLELDPKNARAYINLGTYYGQKGDYDKAIQYFKKALKFAPNLYASYSNIGLVYLNKNQLDSALYYFNKAKKLSPDATTYYNLAITYHRLKQLDRAITSIKKAVELSPNDPVILYTLASFLIEKNQVKTACKYFKLSAQKHYPLAQKALKFYCKQ